MLQLKESSHREYRGINFLRNDGANKQHKSMYSPKIQPSLRCDPHISHFVSVHVGVGMCGFCNVWVCVCVGFVMCGCVYVWVL